MRADRIVLALISREPQVTADAAGKISLPGRIMPKTHSVFVCVLAFLLHQARSTTRAALS